MEKAVVELLICPHCGGELRENGASLICSRGHTMNIARQGYVSLLGRDSGTHTADSAEMVAAREKFLASRHFQPLVDAVVEAATEVGEGASEGQGAEAAEAADANEGNKGNDAAGSAGAAVAAEPVGGGAVVDLGCGSGRYLAAVLDSLPGRIGIGVDNSKFAARRAARSHQRASAVVADIWDGIPIRDGAASVMLNVFSPRNGEEMARILEPGGRLVVVTPQSGHLGELIERFGMISVDPDKEERLERSLGALAERAKSRDLEWTMKLPPDEIRNLVEMGPSAGRMNKTEMAAALEGLEETTNVTAAVTITTV